MGYTEFSSSYSNIFTSGHLRSAPINRTASVFILISICQQTSHSSLNLALLPVNVLFQGNCAMSITLLLNQQCEMLKQWRHQKSTSELKPRTPSVLSDSHGCQWYLRCSCLFQRVFSKLPWRVLFLCVCVCHVDVFVNSVFIPLFFRGIFCWMITQRVLLIDL